MKNKWFVICNPSSGNGKVKRKWKLIESELIHQKIDFEVAFTNYHKHSIVLVKEAVLRGFTNFISIGGDGTLHNVINGLYLSNSKDLNSIKIAVIALGTGNDFIKTYNIPSDYKKVIQLISANTTTKVRVGKITLESSNSSTYFINVAGIGFDGFVVKKIKPFKKLGVLSYLISAFLSILFYKKIKTKYKSETTDNTFEGMMILVGLCKYTGGGMRLTNFNKDKNTLNISYYKNLPVLKILLNIKEIYNGNFPSFLNCKSETGNNLVITVENQKYATIEADGEYIGTDNCMFTLLEKSINVIVP